MGWITMQGKFYQDSSLILLSAGADPTNSIDEFAKKKKKKKYPTKKVSMGKEQDKLDEEEIKNGFVTGGWVVLQNWHLDLEFMAKMEDIHNSKVVDIHEDLGHWITWEPYNSSLFSCYK